MATWTNVEGADALLALSPSETTPLLLELARRQALRRGPADLLARLARDAFVAPSVLDQRTQHRFDGLALDAADGFEAVVLSPVAPLGVCSVLAPTAQDRTLTTMRGTEVVADPTNVLALLAARRLVRTPAEDVRLCTVHQALRAQPLPPQPGFSRHFRLFAMVEAGRGRKLAGSRCDSLAPACRSVGPPFDQKRTKEANMITCYAFAAVPPFAQGLVRDLRVRWALEEAGLPYEVRLVGGGDGTLSRDEYRTIQPFGQIPAIEDGGLTLFESGAIVLHVAERSPALLPRDPAARAHVVQWSFAALNTVEIPIQMLAELDLFHPNEGWARERRPAAVEYVRRRLADLAACLDGRECLTGAFSAADVLMTSVLRILRHTDLLDEQPALAAYKARCEARPAFQKALADQMAVFTR